MIDDFIKFIYLDTNHQNFCHYCNEIRKDIKILSWPLYLYDREEIKSWNLLINKSTRKESDLEKIGI